VPLGRKSLALVIYPFLTRGKNSVLAALFKHDLGWLGMNLGRTIRKPPGQGLNGATLQGLLHAWFCRAVALPWCGVQGCQTAPWKRVLGTISAAEYRTGVKASKPKAGKWARLVG